MSKCLVKIPHKGCSTNDTLQVFEKEDGTVDGYCFKCGEYVKDPYGEPTQAKDLPESQKKAKSKEDILKEMDEISSLSCVDLPDRRLRKGVLEEYGIKIGYSERDGKTPAFAFFPYTKVGQVVRWKVKLLKSGKVWSVGINNDVDLFGWEQAKSSGAKRLILVEGEFDAPALSRILQLNTKKEFSEMIPAICSLPNGAGNAVRDVTRLLPEIRRHFKDVSLAFDQDDAGIKAMEGVCKIMPEAKVITLPDKDANDCLKNGKSKAAFKAVTFNSEKPKNTRIVWGYEVHDKAKTPPEMGLSWPWDGMTRKTRGIRFGETIYIGAGEKMGKSEGVNALAKHLAVDHNLKIMLAKPEESNEKTYKMVNSKVVGKFFHDPNVEFDHEAYDRGGELIKDNICMLNLYQNITWDVLKADIYSAVGQGVKAVFIDPITNLTNGLSSTDTNDTLQKVAQELAAMAKDLDIVIFIFCHLNKPSKGCVPWDRGGKITTDYFAGSSGMARSCNYAIGLQGNKDPELDLTEKNTRELVLLADREFGESGSVKLYWDNTTGLFNEIK